MTRNARTNIVVSRTKSTVAFIIIVLILVLLRESTKRSDGLTNYSKEFK